MWVQGSLLPQALDRLALVKFGLQVHGSADARAMGSGMPEGGVVIRFRFWG